MIHEESEIPLIPIREKAEKTIDLLQYMKRFIKESMFLFWGNHQQVNFYTREEVKNFAKEKMREYIQKNRIAALFE